MFRKESMHESHRRVLLYLGMGLAVSLVAGAVVWVAFVRTTEPTRQPETVELVEVESSDFEQVPPEAPEVPPVFLDAAELQLTVEKWAAEQRGVAAVSILADDGEELAALNADREFFAASIYKLFVAYYGYQQLDAREIDPTELYVNGHTRLECLDLMIRESDSPCAEKLWVELGKAETTKKLEAIGIENTSMTNITTTAHDAAVQIGRFMRGDDLSAESRQKFLDSAREQVYRDALNKGFSSAVTVYNKIGFREQTEYHDVAVVELPDGRWFVISVLSERVGTRGIAELGKQIEALIQP